MPASDFMILCALYSVSFHLAMHMQTDLLVPFALKKHRLFKNGALLNILEKCKASRKDQMNSKYWPIFIARAFL